jgi:hypothetical protein
MLRSPSGGVSSSFSLNRLVAGSPGPWKPNQYTSDGEIDWSFDNWIHGWNYEAVVTATGTGSNQVPVSMVYIDPATNAPVSVLESTSAAPAPPTGVAATDDTFTDRIRVTWNVARGATAYEVWRSGSNDSSTAARVSAQDVIATSLDDTSAAIEVTYWYWVKAKNAAGPSGFSASDQGRRTDHVDAPVMTSVPTRTRGHLTADLSISDNQRPAWTARTVGSASCWRAFNAVFRESHANLPRNLPRLLPPERFGDWSVRRSHIGDNLTARFEASPALRLHLMIPSRTYSISPRRRSLNRPISAPLRLARLR